MVKKHLKPTQANPDGGIVEKEAPIHVSNVMAYDAKAKKASRIGFELKKTKKAIKQKFASTKKLALKLSKEVIKDEPPKSKIQ